MNRCTQSMTGGDSIRWSAARKKADFSWFLPLFLVAVMCLSIFLAMNYRVSYMQKTEQINRDIARMKARERQLDREISNLKFRREQLSSWPLVGDKIRLYHLGLRQANPGQVRVMARIGVRNTPVKSRIRSAGHRRTATYRTF